MRRQVVADNQTEYTEILDDGERYAIKHILYSLNGEDIKANIIILNPKEADKIADFIKHIKN